ncbi:MAG: hypothetical protein GKS07_07370 [Nitrosopumilus sp.]|nr:MAG: hypothetical protein GKS07_07370 [Nitrosopumilus sp.]
MKADGAIVETSKHTYEAPSSSGNPGVFTYDYEFKNIAQKAVGTGAILKLEVIALGSQTDIEGFIQAIEVPTGENPSTYTGS